MRTNDLFLVAAAASMMMFAACTHDDGTLSTASPTNNNEIVITTRSSDFGFTRAESGIQSTQFLNGEHIDIFLRDASGVADLTTYGNPYNYQTNGSGGGILTRDGSTEVKVYWPKLMHPLYIYGIYPQGAVGWSKRKTDCTEDAYNTGNKAYEPDFRYYFIVAADQTSEANYKASDLMTGLPSRYDEESGHTGAYTAPFKLTQNENPHYIPLTFTHRLTKIVVNITKTDETADIDMNDIRYDPDATTPDTKYAVVTLENVATKTWFCVNNTDAVAADRVNVDGDDSGGGVDAQPGTTVIVGKGKTAMSGNTESVTLSAIVPPQTITGSAGSPTHFIKVQLYDGESVTNTFYYDLKSNLTLQASMVHTYNIRINKPNITVRTSISTWGDGGTTSEIGVLQ